MRDLILNDAWDINLVSLKINTSVIEATAQRCKIRLQTLLGEQFDDISLGTPWFQKLLSMLHTRRYKNFIIRKRIIETEGVEKLININFDYSHSRVKVSFEASTLEGNFTLELGGINE